MEINIRLPFANKKQNEIIQNISYSSFEKVSTIDFFKSLYSSPPTMKVKSNLDRLVESDTKLSQNKDFTLYKISKHNTYDYEGKRVKGYGYKMRRKKGTGVKNKIKPNCLLVKSEEANQTKSYIKGYLNKKVTSNFYSRKTLPIRTALQNIPVYTILNGQNEIVLADSLSSYQSNTEIKSFLQERIYNFCGAFDDAKITRKSKLGLFFMRFKDAEFYLNEVMQDKQGVNKFGASIHAVSLDLAYELMRDHHPGFDFRFVPNLDEIISVLENKVTDPHLIFEELQVQVQNYVKKTPGLPYEFSFTKNDAYFKGVPIYFVQLQDSQRNLIIESGLRLGCIIDSVASFFIRSPHKLMQARIDEVKAPANARNFIFFDYEQACKFLKTHDRSISRYLASQIRVLAPICQKPKILITNLEDFLELWERKLFNDNHVGINLNKQNVFNLPHTFFVPTEESKNLLAQIDRHPKFRNFFKTKYQIFKSSFSDLLIG